MNAYIWPLSICGIILQISEQVITVFLWLCHVHFLGKWIFSCSFYLLFDFSYLSQWFIRHSLLDCFLLSLSRLHIYRLVHSLRSWLCLGYASKQIPRFFVLDKLSHFFGCLSGLELLAQLET
jgi:hypothetical protein